MTGFAGLWLSDLLRARAETAPEMKAKERTAIIVVWLHGGPSHLDTYDPKPDAPQEYRGPFKDIPTKVAGMRLCELLPKHAAIADKFTLLRSMSHTGFCHQQGVQQLFTGHPVRELKNKPDHPDCFTIANYARFDLSRPIPNYVGVPPVPYVGSAYLGLAYEPFVVGGNPNEANFEVPNIGVRDAKQVRRLEGRLNLLQRIESLRREIDLRGGTEAIDKFQAQAWSMISSDAVRKAFDLSKESPRLRDKYGRTRWGQQCLLARRLVESGVDLVTTSFFAVENGIIGSWDDHAVNANFIEAMKQRAPIFDQAVSALIEDIYARGLDKRVMVVVTGEFGRTPKINPVNGVPGRDHWPNACSMLFAGGGMTTGQVIGATDARGEQVKDRIVGVRDFLATVYRHLGVPAHGMEFTDYSGRPIPILPEGQLIPELCG
jgi:hypothetical protein